jgi:branched-subunit amino acid transport protein AzlD
MPPSGITLTGTLVRIGLALALVIGTFNPTGYSLFHWITEAPVAVTPGKALGVLALAIAWVVCLRTAFISLGKVGLGLGLALFSVLVWLLVDRDVVSLTGSGIVWVSLVVIGVLLGIGLSWSLLRAKATGQIEVN